MHGRSSGQSKNISAVCTFAAHRLRPRLCISTDCKENLANRLTSTLGSAIMQTVKMPSPLGRQNGGIIINKEEILAKSRDENKGADLVELEVTSRSRGVAGAAALFIGAVVNLITTFVFDETYQIFWVMFFGYSAAQGISNFVLAKRRGLTPGHTNWLAFGIFMSILTAFAVFRLFWGLIREPF